MRVFGNNRIQKSITKHGIEQQYHKACLFIEAGEFSQVDLKLRRPKHHGVWQFRVTKKYRALAVRENGDLYVFHISDHQ